MRFIFLLILIISLNASVSVEKANTTTKELNAQTFVPKATMDGRPVGAVLANSPSLPANSTPVATKSNLKVVEMLQTTLNRLKSKEDESLPKFAPDRPLHPSDRNDNITTLRQILYSLGYLKNLSDSPFFDMELEDAVKSFQTNHCIKPDGIIGKDTEERLNWSYAKRIKMLNDSIEKLNQLALTDRTAIVNIPTYTLYAFEKNNLKMRMKVIVGQSKHPTPQMTSYINAIEFNPAWVIPNSILFAEKIPEITKDIKYLKKNKLQIFDQEGNEVNPSDIDWEEVDQNNFPYIVKQESGKDDALGRLKFNLINNEEIYLHDTPLHDLFNTCPRALSHGCIRLAQPLKLAAWLLDEDIKQVKEAVDTEETATIDLEKNLTVYIAYLPVLVEDNGEILWGDDPYKLEPQPQC